MAVDHATLRIDQPVAPAATYAVLLRRDAETGRYTASLPDLPGFSCQADTPEDATRIVRDAVVAWANNTRDSGGELPAAAEYTLDTIEIPSDTSMSASTAGAAGQFSDALAGVLALTDQARQEFLIAESAVMGERFSDATRHVEWCIDLLMQGRAALSRLQPHGELERVHKLMDYSIALAMQGARKGLQGTCERNVDGVRAAEDIYVSGMEASRAALSELRRLMGQTA